MKTILFLLLSFMCHAQQQAGQVGVTLEYIGDPFEIKSLEPKFDTTKIVMVVSDTLKIWQLKDEGIYLTDANPVKLMYGYAIIQSEFCMIACPDDMPGYNCCVAHYGYGNKKTIGYLDLSKNPISKEIIIWDWKKVE